MAPLPKERIEATHPFNVVGIDFAGPLYAMEQKNEKSYIAIFTCAVTRAVHLVLTTSTSAQSFLMALRRFVSRRGLPDVLYLSNALAFKTLSRDISAVWERLRHQDVQDYVAHNHITWKFSAERAAW